jgi:hypothetical protein
LLADFREAILQPADAPEELQPLIERAEQLEALTGWSRDELLDEIGCEHRDHEQLRADPETIESCTTFLTLLLEAARRVETEDHHRAVIRRCARLSKELNLAVLHATPPGDQASPLTYFALGEISGAVRAARLAAGVLPPASTIGPSPQDGRPIVHLGVSRADWFVRERRDLLGERMFDQIAEHVGTCPACAEAVATRRTLLERS